MTILFLEVGPVIISISQMRKPRQRRAKSFACSHIAKKKLEPLLKTQDLKSSQKLVFWKSMRRFRGSQKQPAFLLGIGEF